MKTNFSIFSLLIAASFLLTSCEAPKTENSNAPGNTSVNESGPET